MAQDDFSTNPEPTATPGIIGNKALAELPQKMREGLEVARQHIAVTGALASMNWGKQMLPAMRRAVAQYCERYNIDPLTELDVLGGNFYITSEYFLRKLGELRRRGIIRDFWFEHVHDDPRLSAIYNDEKMPQKIRDEALDRWTQMLFKRVEQNAPDKATAVCICYIELPSGGHPIRGCKWAGGGTSVKQPRSGGAAQPNPIAESNPELSVESMAARRAARQLISHVDGDIPNFEGMETELADINAQIGEAAAIQEERERRQALEHRPVKEIAGLGSTDAYAPLDVKDGPVPERIEMPGRRGAPPVSVIVKTVHTGTIAPEIERARSVPQMDPYAEDGPAHKSVGAPAIAESFEEPTAAVTDGPAVYDQAYFCMECSIDVATSSEHASICSKFAD